MPKIVILFLMAYLYALVMIFYTSPVWGLYIYEIVYFLNPSDRWWSGRAPNISYSFIVVILTVLVFLAKFKSIPQNTIKEMPAFKWFVLLLLLYTFMSFFAVIPTVHNKYLIELYKLFVFTFIGYKLLSNQKHMEFALFAFIIGGAYIGYEAYVVGRDDYGRVEGIGLVDMPDSNGTSASMVALFPIMIALYLLKNYKVKIFIILAGALLANGLILINSRGAFLGALVGVLYFIIRATFAKLKLKHQKKILVSIILGGLVAVTVLTDDLFWTRMQTIEESSAEDTKSGGRRINFWFATFDMLDDNPVGLGIYGFQVLSPSYLDPELLGLEYRKNAVRAVHSLWFQAMGEIGYFGFFLFMMLLLSVFRQIRKAKNYAIKLKNTEQYYILLSLESGYLGFLIAGSFINAFRAEVHLWMLMFCLAMSAIILRQKDNIEDNDKKELKPKVTL